MSQLVWDLGIFLNPEYIQQWLDSFGFFAPLFYISLMSLAVVISPIPSLPLDIASGAFFGPIWGTIYSVIGASAGAVISFLISRFLGREFIERFLGGHVNFCTSCSDRILTKFVFLSRLLPFISFDIISYGAGLTKMSLRMFVIATVIGMIPLTFIYNYFGSVLVFGKNITILSGLVMVLIFFLVPRYLERKGIIKPEIHK
ncbi:MAG: TVP38/TMEM64 family protein [Nitrospiraceae bacterium]|nr:MAG: TVP38/TMEM64 family protein [Nitrospiraceae bacterium]